MTQVPQTPRGEGIQGGPLENSEVETGTVKTGEVWQALSEDLRAFIGRRITNPAAADDVLQNVFLKVHQGLPTLTEHLSLRAWVYRIARNSIVDSYRLAGREIPSGTDWDDAAAPETNVEDQNESRRIGGWLIAMVDSLPETYREAVRLAELEGLGGPEIAERLELSPSGAKSRIQRGRGLLRKMLARCCALQWDTRGNVVAVEPLKSDCC